MRRSVPTLLVLACFVAACSSGSGSAAPSTGAATPGSSSTAANEASSGPSESAGAGGSAGASSGSGSSQPAMSASGPIFAYGVSYKTGDTIAKTRIDYFTKQYPDVKVTFSESSFAPEGFLTALKSKDAPDVVRLPRERIGTYIARGILEPATDCVTKAGVDMSQYRPAAVNQITMDGVQYGMPEFYWVSDWLIDDDLFQQAGLDPQAWNVADWDQISAANQALLDKTKAKVAIDPKVWNDGDRFPMWVAAAGGKMLSDDGKESLLDSQEVIDAVTFTKGLIDAQGGLVKFKDAIGQTGDFFGKDNGFAKDLEAAFPMQQWYLNVLAGASPDTKITAKPFLSRTGQPVAMEEGDALAVTAASDNKDAACAFITTMTSSAAWLAAAKARAGEAKGGEIQTGTSTGNTAAEKEIFSSLVNVGDNAVFKKAIDAYLGTFDSAFALPPTPAAEEFRQAWIDGLNAALSGEKDPATAMKDADQVAQDAIDQAGAP